MIRYLQAGNLLFWFALELSRPAVAFSLAERISSTSTLGMLLAVQSLLPLFLALPIGLAGDRLGARHLLPCGAALMIGSGLGYWAADGLDLSDGGYVACILGAQLLNGVAWLLVWISTQSLLTVSGEGKAATRNSVNLLALTASIGALGGPAVSGWLYPLGGGAVWLLFLVMASGLTLIALRVRKLAGRVDLRMTASQGGRAGGQDSRSISDEQFDGKNIRPMYAFVLLASFVLFVGAELRASFMPAYLTQSGVHTPTIGAVLTAGAVAVGIVRLLISANLLKLGERATVGLSFSMTVAGVALLPLASDSGPAAMAAVSVMLAAAVGIGEPLLIVTILKHVREAKRGLALAGRLTANRAAMLVAPMGAGFAIHAAGPALGLPILGFLLAIISVIAGALFWRYGVNQQDDLRKAG